MNPADKLAEIAKHLSCEKIARVVLDNERFAVWPGSSKPDKHHYGKGGLAQHTFEVAELCLLNNNYFKEIGQGVDDVPLFLAALFHDIGKTWDYVLNEDGTWSSSTHKNMVYHISRSGIVWSQAVKDTGLHQDIEMEVLHGILSHHGQKNWGSPVEPKTRLAWLLHLCDNLSARSNDYNR